MNARQRCLAYDPGFSPRETCRDGHFVVWSSFMSSQEKLTETVTAEPWESLDFGLKDYKCIDSCSRCRVGIFRMIANIPSIFADNAGRNGVAAFL